MWTATGIGLIIVAWCVAGWYLGELCGYLAYHGWQWLTRYTKE